MGKPAIVETSIEGQRIPALLDTGATVSTIVESVVAQLGLSINPVQQILRIECANGQQLPYVGCVVADISINRLTTQPCLLLVVPDTSHTQTIPLLLGTNNLEKLLPTEHGELQGPLQMVANCLEQRRRNLMTNKGSIAQLSCTAKGVIHLDPGSMASVPVSVGSVLDLQGPMLWWNLVTCLTFHTT